MLTLTYAGRYQANPIVTIACGSDKEAFNLFGILSNLDSIMYVTVRDSAGGVVRDYTISDKVEPITSKPLTYSELERGDKFISFPIDGDDSGHGGYRGAHNLFMKLSDTEAVNMERGVISSHPKASQGMKVIKVNA